MIWAGSSRPNIRAFVPDACESAGNVLEIDLVGDVLQECVQEISFVGQLGLDPLPLGDVQDEGDRLGRPPLLHRDGADGPGRGPGPCGRVPSRWGRSPSRRGSLRGHGRRPRDSGGVRSSQRIDPASSLGPVEAEHPEEGVVGLGDPTRAIGREDPDDNVGLERRRNRARWHGCPLGADPLGDVLEDPLHADDRAGLVPDRDLRDADPARRRRARGAPRWLPGARRIRSPSGRHRGTWSPTPADRSRRRSGRAPRRPAGRAGSQTSQLANVKRPARSFRKT